MFARLALAVALSGTAISAVRADTTQACNVSADVTRLPRPLTQVAKNLAAGEPITIVALGSSSTAGAGASSPSMSYPSRLQVELERRFPGQPFRVINSGANGEEAPDMLARFEQSVAAEKPDLIIWQVGTNSVLRDRALPSKLLHDGLERMKAIGADVILIDPQFAPKVLAKAEAEGMVQLIASTAKQENVHLFQRFALMRKWYQTENIPFETFVSSDGLHMNDWSYGCLAKVLGATIAEAATRSVATVSAHSALH